MVSGTWFGNTELWCQTFPRSSHELIIRLRWVWHNDHSSNTRGLVHESTWFLGHFSLIRLHHTILPVGFRIGMRSSGRRLSAALYELLGRCDFHGVDGLEQDQNVSMDSVLAKHVR